MNIHLNEGDKSNHQEVERLQSRVRTLLCLTVTCLILGVVSFGVALGAAAGALGNEDDITDIKTTVGAPKDVILRVGAAKGVSGYPHAYSLYAGSGFWTDKKALPTPTSDFQAVSAGDKIYLIGGQNKTGGGLDTLIEYDTALEKYKVLPSMPAPRMRFGAAIHAGKIYVIGGLVSDGIDFLKTTFIYDIAKKTWSTGPELTTSRSDTCAAAANDGKIYVVAGYTTDYATLKSVEMLDTTATTLKWSAAPDLPDKRGDVTCASSGSKVYAIGGYHDPKGAWTPNSFHPSMFELDSKTTPGAWKNMTAMPTARGDKAAVTLSDGSIVVIGGEGHARGEGTQIARHPVEQFFPDHNTWITKASIPTARFRFAAAAVGNFVHAFGGHVLCTTVYGNVTTSDCASKTLDSHQVLMDVTHPDIWVHASKK